MDKDLELLASIAVGHLNERNPHVDRESIIRKLETLLDKYFAQTKSFHPPVKVERLAQIAGIKVKRCLAEKRFEGALLPVGDSFQLLVNKNLALFRQRHVICHEIVHSFFYKITPEGVLKRVSGRTVSHPEEALCLELARRLLIPDLLLTKQLEYLRNQDPLEAIPKVRLDYGASLNVVMERLVRDSSLWPEASIVLWKRGLKTSVEIEAVVHGSFVRSSLPKYALKEACKVVKPMVLRCMQELSCIKEEIVVGQRVKRHYLIKLTPVFNLSTPKQESYARVLGAIYPLSK
jgi:Zn-dependent peptidase ImmA (M78 family)